MTAASGSPLLDVRSLSVRYGKVEAVHNVSLRADEGSIVTVIGPNGAGKTTLLGAVMGLLPAQGEVSYRGESLFGLSVEDRVARGLVLVPEKRELFASMSVADNLALGAFARRREGEAATKRALDEVYHRFPRLLERRAQLAGTLSGGERQMLALGRALMGRPKLLMLDEPSLGLAPNLVDEVLQTLATIRSRGVAVLLVEQVVEKALAFVDHAYLLQSGRITADGPAAQMQGSDQVRRAYLGDAAAVHV